MCIRDRYPLWSRLDEEGSYVSAWVGLAELALSGCTTSTDHLYLHPVRGGDLLSAEIAAASELGMRFHPTRGSMSLSVKDGGLPPDDVVSDDDSILAASEEAVRRHHDPSFGSMVQIALAPCSPFSVTRELMVRSAAVSYTHLDVYKRQVREHVGRAILGSDEAEALVSVEPLDGADSHGGTSFREAERTRTS